jgi:protein gp37
MGEQTGIVWAHHTFNPWIGCTKVSAACDHCYAEALNNRHRWAPGWGNHPRQRTSTSTWETPLKWDRAAYRAGERRRVFCASLADVFDNHRSITSGWHGDLWHLISQTPNLDWLLLTKRPQNIEKMLPESYGMPEWGRGWANVWLGTTVEHRDVQNQRLKALCAVPARLRFISAEPLLDYLDIDTYLEAGLIHWVISGGESGPQCRISDASWHQNLANQCLSHDVPYLFKQHSGVNARVIKSKGRKLFPKSPGIYDQYPTPAEEW